MARYHSSRTRSTRFKRSTNPSASAERLRASQADSDAIGANRIAVEELKKELDGPEEKVISERYDTFKAQLDEIKEDELYANRSQLFDERTSIQ